MNTWNVAIAVAFVGAISSPVAGGQKVYVGSSQPSHLVSIDAIDHSVFDGLLKQHVDKDGLVNYRAIKNSQAAMQQLDSYLGTLSTADVGAASKREAKLAYWINAYNAVTLRGMLREYPTTSIKKHVSVLFGYNIWKDLQLYVGGIAYSLEDIEHKILRKMSEPRIHFAIVCASKGCPRLLNEAYTADRVNEQLELNTKDFFSRPQNFRFQANRIQLSSILDWYGEDFGASRFQQLRTYAKWLPTTAAQQAANSGKVPVSFLKYDWSINEQPARSSLQPLANQRR